MTEGQLIRDEQGRFLPGTAKAQAITHANAREMQQRSVQSRIERSRAAVRQAFERGEGIHWADGYERAAAALVDIIFDGDAKDTDKVRAFAELRRAAGLSQLDQQQPVKAVQNNYFQDGDSAAAFLSQADAARCPACGEMREYGVQHECRNETGADHAPVQVAGSSSGSGSQVAGDRRGAAASGQAAGGDEDAEE